MPDTDDALTIAYRIRAEADEATLERLAQLMVEPPGVPLD